MKLSRDPQQASRQEYGAIIIGGGVYGLSLALEAGLRGIKTLLLEKGDFGEQTSFNSLKIIHGGLRYLQSMDLHRFRESVNERSWFLRHFPRHVQPLPCFMPLYGKGLRRPSVFRIALLANHLLALNRNAGLDKEHQLPMGRVIGTAACRTIFPLVDPKGLKGGVVWYDACMPDSQLLLMDMLHIANSMGCSALNYVQATDLQSDGHGYIQGVVALDRESGQTITFAAPLVINAAGPWCRTLLEGVGGDQEALYRPSLAWNVCFDRPALSDHALAVQARKPGSRLFFVTPWKGRIFAGTGHEPWSGGIHRPMPNREQLQQFIQDLNLAVPGLELQLQEVHRIFAGLLPTTAVGSNRLTKREVIVDHGQVGGPRGLYSVGGIKFTTARLVAEKVLKLAEQKKEIHTDALPGNTGFWPGSQDTNLETYRNLLADDDTIIHLDDLVLRRCDLWEAGEETLAFAEKLCDLFPWDEQRKKQELAKCAACLRPLPEQ